MNYGSNVLLVVILLILLVPSWRVSFQGWFQSFFLSDVTLEESMHISVEGETQKWDLFDTEHTLYAFHDFKGQPIVLSFWATWCPPCRAELPELQELKEYFNQRAHVIAVSEESLDAIKDSGLDQKYDFLYSTQQIPDIFQVTAFPTLVILNTKLEMVHHSSGAGHLNTTENKEFIEGLIKNG